MKWSHHLPLYSYSQSFWQIGIKGVAFLPVPIVEFINPRWFILILIVESSVSKSSTTVFLPTIYKNKF
jgi:hypothetical protein